MRKVYAITPKGIKLLEQDKEEWKTFSLAVNQVLAIGVM